MKAGPVKVVYVLGTSSGGTARHVRMLADGLARRGVPVTVYAPAATWTAVRVPAETSGGAGTPQFEAVEIAERPRPARDLAAVRRLRGLLARSRPDVVHAHGLRAGALAAVALGASNQRPRLIVTVHNAPPEGGAAGTIYRVLEQVVARRADQVLCVSSDLESRMRRLGARNVARALVPAPAAGAGVSAETRAALRAELGAAGEPVPAPVVLAVARLAPQKGLDTLIQAAARWRDRDPAPVLAIAGTGPLQAGLAAQAAAGLVNARFLGHRADVPALLAAADVVVLPSVWEGQPLIVQETLRAGRPLVATWVGGIPDLIGEGAAMLVPADDVRALSEAVLKVLDDPGLAAQLGEAALKQAGALPTEEDALDAALAGYYRLIAG
ncbi:MAG TPA: glycosyltransferase family 4 protein [Streptosporangiaceae bacterium]